MRKFVVAVVLVLGVIFIIGSLADLEKIVETLRRGNWQFILLGLGLELVWMVNVAAAYRAIYRALGIEESILNLMPVSIAAIFANVVVPAVGMSGAAVFIAEARRRNYSPGRATAAGALYILFDYAAFICILILGLTVLFRRDKLTMVEILSSALFLIIAACMTLLLFIGVRNPRRLGDILAGIARIINRFLHPFLRHDFLSEERAHQFAHEISEGLHEIRRGPANLLWPFGLALSKMALLALILWVVFQAFDVPNSVGTIIGGFSLYYLFFIVSPTPAGIGFLEGGMPLALQSLRVAPADAFVITLAYRGITFWIPLVAGMVAFRWLGGAKDAKAIVG